MKLHFVAFMPAFLVLVAATLSGAAAAWGRTSGHGFLKPDRGLLGKKLTSFPFPISESRCPTSFAHVVCSDGGDDIFSDVALRYDELTPKENHLPMTPNVCFEFCSNITGAQFFGLALGFRCICGTTFRQFGLGNCDIMCPGDDTRACGGQNSVDVYEMHDCNNLPIQICKRSPKPVEHAVMYESRYYRKTKTPCKNAQLAPLSTTSGLCDVECILGYELVSNDISCVEQGNPLTYAWAQVVGHAICSPISCGRPPVIDYGTGRASEMFFPEKALFTCQTGYTVTGTAEGNTTQTVMCTSNATFSTFVSCRPVTCGKCSFSDRLMALPKPDQTDSIVFTASCKYRCLEGYTIDQRADGSAEFETTCLATGAFSEPRTCGRVSCGKLPHYPDAKAVGRDANETGFYDDNVTVKCNAGYTTDGVVSGDAQFTVTCTSSGRWTQSPKCEPVLCGDPPAVNNASYPLRSMVFKELVTYVCDTGFTKTGKIDGGKQKTLSCSADGQFVPDAPSCMPVECGAAPQLKSARLLSSALDTYTYVSPLLHYACLPGFSTRTDDDPWNPQHTKISSRCDATGFFLKTPECKNIDSCLMLSCGEFGYCSDEEDPKGVPLDDYKCVCEPGYEQTFSSESSSTPEKMCTDINDCPVETACGGVNRFGDHRGTCRDQIENYTCRCASGYELTYVAGNATCSPISCGDVPQVGNATHTADDPVNFDTDAWTYTCDEGYTLSGVVRTETSFNVSCEGALGFGGLRECLPVSCGDLPSLKNAEARRKTEDLRFKETAMYNCDEGYSLNAKATGATSFEISCGSNGSLSKPPSCVPVECGYLPSQENASFENSTQKFGMSVSVVCMEGFSLDRTTNAASTIYYVDCQSNGTFSHTRDCKPVTCGTPVSVNHTTWDAKEKFYMQVATYTLEAGFTINGSANGEKEFTTTCMSDGRFSPTKYPKRVLCGDAPARENARHPRGVYYSFDLAQYRCMDGYSVDGDAKGLTNFSLACASTGIFEGSTQCLPVSCGEIVPPLYATRSTGGGENLDEIVFGQSARFDCNPGFSTDGRLDSSSRTVRVECSHTGELQYNGNCVNMDDCDSLANRCAPTGNCVDRPEPTGTHMNDFECACHDGFGENVTTSTRFCFNLPDCPEDACSPGRCVDLVNEYTCACDDGYTIGPNEKDGFSHDCNAISCGKPKEFSFADLIQEIGEVFFDSPPVEYHCREGHSRDGFASGEKSFSLRCHANATFSKAPTCVPIVCSSVPQKRNAVYLDQPLRYDETVVYNCEHGFSTSGRFGEGVTTFSATCQANGTFSRTQNCLPVSCGSVPLQQHVIHSHSERSLVYQERSEQTCSPGYALDKWNLEMTSYSITCGAEGDLEYSSGKKRCEPISCGRLDVRNANVTGDETYGASVTVTCDFGFCTNGDDPVSTTLYKSVCQANGQWSEKSDCKAVPCGEAPSVASATRNSNEPVVFPQTVTYATYTGFTLTCSAEGPKTFEITCQADGQFTAAAKPCPVSCGVPPARNNSANTGSNKSYLQQETYTCNTGFSTTGHPPTTHNNYFKLTCDEHGIYSGDGECKPVSCGVITVPYKSKQIPDESGALLPTVVFPLQAKFECDPGYSLDGRVAGKKHFSTRCTADGSMSAHAGCKNVNDCEGHQCGPHGSCVDHSIPTGDHAKDFHCRCEDGFEEEVFDNGTRVCGNTPDCPVGACLPGSCVDLINDYQCICDSGYHEAANLQKGLKHDCLANKCGAPPHVEYASTAQTESVYFDSAAVEYACVSGYSLDGSSDGYHDFEISCLANKSFETAPTCFPVKCGRAPSVENTESTNSSKLFVFPEKLPTYKCIEGFSLDGDASAEKQFDVECLPTGDFLGLKQCVRVSCPTTDVDIGNNSNSEEFVNSGGKFGDIVQITCDSGYALEEEKQTEGFFLKRFFANCQADGRWLFDPRDTNSTPSHLPPHCVRVNCGDLIVENASVSGGTRYGETMFVTCREGFSLDGSCCDDGAKQFTVQCLASGEFSAHGSCRRVDCNSPPEYESARLEENGTLFGDVARYTTLHGFTWNGQASGPTDFEITCRENATWSPMLQPLPVLCGEPIEIANAAPERTGDYVFGEQVRYICDEGYLADGQSDFFVACTSAGNFDVVGSCSPRMCGQIEMQINAVGLPDPATGVKFQALKYGQTAAFGCKAGFSTDGVLDSPLLSYNVTCQSSGKIFYPATCINVDDCASPLNNCNPSGTCSDNKIPTGRHEEDFKCRCDEGFIEEITQTGSRMCVDAVDCPDDACKHGVCIDLLNSYTCNCSSGYFEGANEDKGLQRDCLPVSCGILPPRTYAEGPRLVHEVYFGSPSIPHNCITGYTLDGIVSGNTHFEVACLATGQFEVIDSCLPISCGPVPELSFADVEAREAIKFDDPAVVYTCHHGYTIDGHTSGKNTFSRTCGSDGNLIGKELCMPVRCSSEFWDENAAFDRIAATNLAYGDFLLVSCSPGYRSAEVKVAYKATCMADGSIHFGGQCTPIDCGEIPLIPGGDVEGSTLYGGVLTATAWDGFSTDGTSKGNTSFNFHCLASGDFSFFKPFIRIECDCDDIHRQNSEVTNLHNCPNLNWTRGKVLLQGSFETCDDRMIEGRTSDICEAAFILYDDDSVARCSFNEQNGCVASPLREQCGFVAVEALFPGTSEKKISILEKFEPEKSGKKRLFAAFSSIARVSQHKRHMTKSHVRRAQRGGLGRSGDASIEARYGDVVEVQCKQGYRAVDVRRDERRSSIAAAISDPGSFRIFCAGGGQFLPADIVGGNLRTLPKESQYQTQCAPVTCEVPAKGGENWVVQDAPALVDFQTRVAFSCEDGYSLNGTPAGLADFQETCQANGALSKHHVCEDIDWCMISNCGDHGRCDDELLGYSCSCDPGFRVGTTATGLQTCVEVDECAEVGGRERCASFGAAGASVCTDRLGGYNCTCEEGFENNLVIVHATLTADEHKADSCVRVKCPRLRENVMNATLSSEEKQCAYEESAEYRCLTGHTVDGVAGSAETFTVKCEATKQYTGFRACKPISCGTVPDVPLAEMTSVLVTELFFSQTAKYTCTVGHTITGRVGDWTDLTVGCAASGMLTRSSDCIPVSCGKPPKLFDADVNVEELLFDQNFTFSCSEGYSTTGRPGAPTSFDVRCNENGILERDQENLTISSASCSRITCGFPKKVEHSTMQISELFSGDQIEAACNSGYSVTGAVDGKRNFIATCLTTGHISGMQECLPVSCGKPSDTSTSAPMHGSSENVVFGEIVMLVCKAGYSIDGSSAGNTSYEIACLASGEFSQRSPCTDIDFCYSNPCSANGVCTDAGNGVVAPGYSCTCEEGYEVETRLGGGETCSADDCKGSPCGEGGQCIDLSKEGGQQGMYRCECTDGYDLVTSDAQYCKRSVCGRLPHTLENVVYKDAVPFASVTPWMPDSVSNACRSVDCSWTREWACPGQVVHGSQGEKTPDDTAAFRCCCTEMLWKYQPSIDTMYSTPILKSFDTATYTCKEGHSVDGSMDQGSSTFAVRCDGSGIFTPLISQQGNCVRVKCDGSALVNIAHAVFLGTRPFNFEYGDSAKFRCFEGYTLGGQLGDDTDFSISCQKDGTLADFEVSCLPIKCNIPDIPHATCSHGSEVAYLTEVSFECADGYVGTGGQTSFSSKCEASGALSYIHEISHPICSPRSCGVPPTQAGAQIYVRTQSPLTNQRASAIQLREDGLLQKQLSEGKRRIEYLRETISSFAQEVSVKTSLDILREHLRSAYRVALQAANSRDTKLLASFAPSELKRIRLNDVETTANRLLSVLYQIEHSQNTDLLQLKERANRSFNSLVSSGRSIPAGYEPWPNGQLATTESDLVVVCNSGNYVGGITGRTMYVLECQNSGVFSTVNEVCSTLAFQVGGVVTDVKDASAFLEGVTVSADVDGVPRVTLSGSDGRYMLQLPAGNFNVTATKAGYIPRRKTLSVDRDVQPGGSADLAISKELAEGEWRVVSTWGEHSRDVDLHVTFGPKNAREVYWNRQSYSDYQSGLTVTLDRDDQHSYGPETMTASGVGKCKQGSGCLLRFRIENWTPYDGPLGSSDVRVEIYAGTSLQRRVDVPKSIGTQTKYELFVLDATEGRVGLHDAGWAEPVYFGEVFTKRVYSNYGWIKFDDKTVLTGLTTQGKGDSLRLQSQAYTNVFNSRLGDYGTCTTVNLGNQAEGWQNCAGGSYITDLYVGRSRYSGRYQVKIKQAKCCTDSGLPSWGECIAKSSWTDCGKDSSGRPLALVGVHTAGGNSLSSIDLFRCCALPTV